MVSRIWAAAALSASMLLMPVAAFAQQAPDGTSVNEPPAAGPQAAVDACGNTPDSAFGDPTAAGTPQNINDANPKDITGAQPVPNMSSVTGFVVHSAGDLVLLQVPREAATGMNNPTPSVSDRGLAVIRLPSNCSTSFGDGTQLRAVGVPTTGGILNAEQVRTSE
jgi:hypothetical protein